LIFVYSAYNRYDRALEYLNIKRKYIAEDDSLRISDYYKDLASISSAMGNNQAAIDYIRKADAIIPLDVEKKRNIYISYGYYFDELGIADSALYYLDRAMYYDGWKNKIKLQAVLNYYSTKQKYYGNVEIKTIDSLETIIKEHDLKGDLPQLLALKSQVLKDTFYIHQAIDISKKHRPEFYLDLIEELADLQFKLKHYEESRTNSELYHKLKDSVEQYKSSVILKNLSEFTPESDKTTEEKENYILYILLAAILALILYIVYTKSRKS
jgi:tetratricopeptide (TPR) repeat protein